jgi:hypothetical protein
MRSIFSKLAVAAFITIGFITQETQSVQIRNLVHAQKQEANSHPTLLAEVLLGSSITAPSSTTTGTSTVSSKEAPKVTSQPVNVSGPAPKAPTTSTTTTPAANTQPAKTSNTAPAAQTAPAKTPAQAPPAKDTSKPEPPKTTPVSSA